MMSVSPSGHKLRGTDSNRRHPGSEPGVLAAELPRHLWEGEAPAELQWLGRSLALPFPSVAREGLEPSRHGGRRLLRTACLPFHHLAVSLDGWI